MTAKKYAVLWHGGYMAKIDFCDARGSLNQLNDCLAGENGDLWLASLIRFLRSLNSWEGFPIWKVVSIDGAHLDYRKLFRESKLPDPDIDKLLGCIPLEQGGCEEIDLVDLSPQQLGFTRDDTLHRHFYSKMCETAIKRGLEYCPAEAGLKLAFACTTRDLPKEQGNILVGMQPIRLSRDGDEDDYILAVVANRNGGMRLWIEKARMISFKEHIVFKKPRR